jgi:hypothetical protein
MMDNDLYFENDNYEDYETDADLDGEENFDWLTDEVLDYLFPKADK